MQNFDRIYLWNYNSYGPVVEAQLQMEQKIAAFFQPFGHYLKIMGYICPVVHKGLKKV